MATTEKSYDLGRLGVIGMRGCEEMTCRVNEHLKKFNEDNIDGDFETFIIPINCPRFGTGEAKAMIMHSIRTYDIYIIMDAFNYGVTYNMYGSERPMSPDDHYQDALMLQELTNMGVSNIITFDAHDARVQNSIPLCGFENVHPTYQMIKACLKYDEKIILDKENTMIVSPDEGAMGRCMYYSSVLGMNLGTFYKRRDYSTIINGKNPIVAHEFLGNDIAGKDVIVVDDMIASGESMIDVCRELKARNAKKVIVFATFGLFTEGIEKFNKANEEGLFDAVFTTNLVYRSPELKAAPWYHEVDMSKYIALIIKQLNDETSISNLLTPISRIERILDKYRNKAQ